MVPKHQTGKMVLIQRSLPERERKPVPLCQEVAFFLYACVIRFSCEGPLGVSANLSFPFFFLIQFNFFKFIYSLPTIHLVTLDCKNLEIKKTNLACVSIQSLCTSSMWHKVILVEFLKSEFFFSKTGCKTQINEPSLPFYLLEGE